MKKLVLILFIFLLFVMSGISFAESFLLRPLVHSSNNYSIIGYIDSFKLDNREDDPVNGITDLKEALAYTVKSGDSLYLIAREFETTINRLREFNNLDTDMLIVGQKLLIPGINSGTPEETYRIYTVEAGDTLYKLAEKFEVSIEEIKEASGLERDMLYIGDELIIPQGASNEESQEDSDSKNKKKEKKPKKDEENNNSNDEDNSRGETYIVQPGDSLYLIAREHDITVEELKSLNNLEGNMILVGQELIISAVEDSENSDEDVDNRIDYTIIKPAYNVEENDTLEKIAAKFNVSVESIIEVNQLETEKISEDMEKLMIPVKVPTADMKEKVEVTEEELELLARAVHSEARGEPFKGQAAVAAVIINRMKHSYFPDSVEEVIFQPYQFSAVEDGQFWLEPNEQSYTAARAALAGWDPAKGAIFYYNPETAQSDWVFYRDVVVEIGDHYFAVSI